MGNDMSNGTGIVTSDEKPKKRLNLSKRKMLLLSMFAIFVAFGFGGYTVFIKQKAQNKVDEIPTVTKDGKEYKAAFLKVEGLNAAQPEGGIDYEARANEQASKLDSSSAKAQDYLLVAQLYVQANNKTKATEYYEKTKQQAQKEGNYDLVKSVEQILNRLQEGSSNAQ
jgi:hypothetical protein